MRQLPIVREPWQGWTPRESFSPSQISLYQSCPRAWAERYLFGRSVLKKSWSTMLGSVIHACVESHLQGRTVYQFKLDKRVKKEFAEFTKTEQDKIVKQAPQRALAGLHLLPDPRECEELEIEQNVTLDTASLLPEVEPLTFNMKLDLRYKRAGVRYLNDHKSTRDFGWMKTEEQLLTDVQGVLYATAEMQKWQLPEIWGRWTYFLTDQRKHPEAKCTDVLFRWSEIQERAVTILRTADEMRRIMREFVAGGSRREDFVQNPEACGDYGGCAYHGNPCAPPARAIVF